VLKQAYPDKPNFRLFEVDLSPDAEVEDGGAAERRRQGRRATDRVDASA